MGLADKQHYFRSNASSSAWQQDRLSAIASVNNITHPGRSFMANCSVLLDNDPRVEGETSIRILNSWSMMPIGACSPHVMLSLHHGQRFHSDTPLAQLLGPYSVDVVAECRQAPPKARSPRGRKSGSRPYCCACNQLQCIAA